MDLPADGDSFEAGAGLEEGRDGEGVDGRGRPGGAEVGVEPERGGGVAELDVGGDEEIELRGRGVGSEGPGVELLGLVESGGGGGGLGDGGGEEREEWGFGDGC